MAAHEDRVFAVCMRVMGNRDAALDATQETFVTLFRKAAQFKGDSALSTWLYRVAVNTCYDLLRKQQRRRAEPLPEDRDLADSTAADHLASVEVRPEIETALAALPEEFRAAVILSDLEALPLAVVAEALDVPIGTVKSRVFRGRKLLAESLGNLRAGSQHPMDEP
jgi:RNA polymerase sigma-70 factor (ECF subfamily)